MAATNINAYFIECITNMHVGSGDANYGVVDKLIQRDPVTGYPTIHSSSLKGALREYFEGAWGKDSEKVNKIFGREAKDGKDSTSGDYKFFGADLIAIPVRSNYKQFALTLSPELIKLANHTSNLLTGKDIINKPGTENCLYVKNPKPEYDVYFEDYRFEVKDLQALLKNSGINSFNDRYAYADDEKFRDLIKNLPVIARNQLDSGVSKNLWYEEVVPHHSVFITFVTTTSDLLKEFEDELLKEGATIQIGGNASVGYGISKFHKITF